MAVYLTHTGLTLKSRDKKVVLIGDREKLLYPVNDEEYDFNKAGKVYNETKAHYEARKAEEGAKS